jgi:hypothetical protein
MNEISPGVAWMVGCLITVAGSVLRRTVRPRGAPLADGLAQLRILAIAYAVILILHGFSLPDVEILRSFYYRSPVEIQRPDQMHEYLVQWAIQNQRIIISRDFNTLIAWHDDCVSKGQATPGLFIIRPGATIPAVVESLVFISHCSTSEEWSNCCNFIPLPGARE